MDIERIEQDFSVCKIPDLSQTDLSDTFCFVGKTDRELSLVCRTDDAPKNASERSDGWKAFRVHGVLDFSLIGILAEISGILAEKRIGIFVVSTYDTDYVLTKKEDYEQALSALAAAGWKTKN